MAHQIDDYTKDGTVDLKGTPVRRSKRGSWKACFFVVVYQLLERMTFYGISSNLVIYLSSRLHQGTVTSANNVNSWIGTLSITPILGAYVADAHLGRYWTFIISSAIYLAGMAILTLAVTIPGLKPPPCSEAQMNNCKKASTLQLAVFYGGLYIIAIGTGGTKPNISTIGADQFDVNEPNEKAHKLSFFNWWLFIYFTGILLGNTIMVYIQDNVGWALGYGLPTIVLLISNIIFVAGTRFYRHKLPTGSPFTRMAQVIVAAIKKRKLPMPNDHSQLYELDLGEYTNNGKLRIRLSPSLRFLNRAAVITNSRNPWNLCTVTQIEETKQMLNMIPILITTLVPSVMVAQVNTLFVKQATTLDRSVGRNFQIPPASMIGFTMISMLVCVVLYDKIFVKYMRKITSNPRGISFLQRMGVGMVLHILVMTTASLIERRRIHFAREHGLVGSRSGGDTPLPLTVFTLLPQFLLMGVADAFLEVPMIEFFYDQAPENMKSLGTSYSTTSNAIGSFLSSFLLSIVSHVTQRHGHNGWILNNLNASHLDYYYGFFAILNTCNFILFLVVAKFYAYKAEVHPVV